MNWYIVVAILSSFLLGWGIGIWFGVSKGYKTAVEEQRQLMNQQMWSDYIQSFVRRDSHEER